MRASLFPSLSLALGALVVVAGCESSTEVVTDAPNLSLVGERGRKAAEGTSTSRYIVAMSDGALPESLAGDVSARGGTLLGALPQIGLAFVEAEDAGFARSMSRVRGVALVVPDQLVEFDDPTIEGAPLGHGTLPGAGAFDFLTWGVDAVGAPAAWAAGNRGSGVRVAVLDAGIDHEHPDLAGNLNTDLSTSFVPCLDPGDPTDPTDYNCDGQVEDWRILPGFGFNHGTHVAGTIAATGDVGVTGVAPNAELVVVKVCTELFNACFTSSIVSGLVYAADVDADLVNMSLGGLRRMRNDFVPFCRSQGFPTTFCAHIARFQVTFQDDFVHQAILVYQRAFEYARRQGTTVIVAAGNDALDADRSKDVKLAFADFPHTIAVSALGPLGWCIDSSTSTDGQAYYTNTGQSAIDVAAPGGNFLGFFLGAPYTDNCTLAFITRPAFVFDGVFSTISQGWGWAQGTSMAAPHATGVAALLIARNGGDLSPPEVERALKSAAEDLGAPGHDAVYGAGRVSAGY